MSSGTPGRCSSNGRPKINMGELSCDILIIGSGAAGGTLAATLSEYTDKKIILVEKGGYFASRFFDQREIDANVLIADRGTRFTSDGWIPVAGGECVGGGTTVNLALSFDPVQSVWRGWKGTSGLNEFTFNESASDYGVPGLNMLSCLGDVRRRLNVHAPDDAEINDNNRIFKHGCDALGVKAKRFELNMRGCIGCGFCALGCAYDRKQGTMITYIADALKRGVTLIHHCGVDSIELTSRSGEKLATSAVATVRPTAPGSEPNSVAPGPLRIWAQLIVVSAGAIESPALLQRSRIPDPTDVLGRGLILHPSLALAGIFDRKVRNYRGITGAYYSDHFYESHGFYYECLFRHPAGAAVSVPFIGVDHFELMMNYDRFAAVGAMLIDTASSENRVAWDPLARKTSIHYKLAEADKERLRFAAQRGVEIMFAAGAKEVFITSEEPVGPLSAPNFREATQAAFCADLDFRAFQTVISSAHCQASVKMSENPGAGAINSRCESHYVRNLLVCDSSSFPTSCGANPMISIMSLARYQGKRIAGELHRYWAEA